MESNYILAFAGALVTLAFLAAFVFGAALLRAAADGDDAAGDR